MEQEAQQENSTESRESGKTITFVNLKSSAQVNSEMDKGIPEVGQGMCGIFQRVYFYYFLHCISLNC